MVKPSPLKPKPSESMRNCPKPSPLKGKKQYAQGKEWMCMFEREDVAAAVAWLKKTLFLNLELTANIDHKHKAILMGVIDAAFPDVAEVEK